MEAEVALGDGQQIYLPAILQVSGDDVPDVAHGRGRGEHPPVLVEPEEGGGGLKAHGYRERGDAREVPEEDVDQEHQCEQVRRERGSQHG